MEIITTDSLTKKYNGFVAVDNLSIHVEKGEIYGFLGLNGAGKTTTIRMLLGMIKPDHGNFQLFGHQIKSNKMNWNDVGYMVETPYSYPNLTVFENLKVYAKLRKLDNEHITEIIEKLFLTPYQNKKANNLSHGNQQRLGIAKALMHRPDLLILDEPINGLDPKGIVQVRDLLKSLSKQGTTVFLSSHILSEISKLATRIGIIHNGKLIQELYTSKLGKQLIKKLIIDSTDNIKAIKVLKDAGYIAQISSDGLVEISDNDALSNPENVSTLLVKMDCPPTQIYKYVEDLEHYFLRIIEKEKSA